MIKRILIIPFAISLLLVFSYTNFKISQFMPGQEISVFLLTLSLFIAMLGWELIYRCDSSLANKRWFRTIAWIGSTLLGIWVTFTRFSLIIDIDRLAFLAFTTLTHIEILKQWVEKMHELGLTPLINENQIISFADIKILIAGITDISSDHFLPSHKSDTQKAISSNDKTDFAILLSHNPRTIKDAEKAGFNLQLSGHTHAGQFFPFNLLFFWPISITLV